MGKNEKQTTDTNGDKCSHFTHVSISIKKIINLQNFGDSHLILIFQ